MRGGACARVGAGQRRWKELEGALEDANRLKGPLHLSASFCHAFRGTHSVVGVCRRRLLQRAPAWHQHLQADPAVQQHTSRSTGWWPPTLTEEP